MTLLCRWPKLTLFFVLDPSGMVAQGVVDQPFKAPILEDLDGKWDVQRSKSNTKLVCRGYGSIFPD